MLLHVYFVFQVHVWSGISYRGRTSICIFSGIMHSINYQNILQSNLLPFVEHQFPGGFRLYHVNINTHIQWNLFTTTMFIPNQEWR